MSRKQLWSAVGLLLLLQAGSCASSPAGPVDNRVPTGTWGGEHVGLAVTETGAHVEFDCASGDISEPLTVDGSGQFAVDGVYVQEHPGPVRVGEEPEKRPARYAGTLDGRTMTLAVTLKESNEVVGTFALSYGAASGVRKCR